MIGAAWSEAPHAPRFEPTGDADRQPQLGGDASGIAEAFERLGSLGLGEVDGSDARELDTRDLGAARELHGLGLGRDAHPHRDAGFAERACGGRQCVAQGGGVERSGVEARLRRLARQHDAIGSQLQRQLQQRRRRRQAQLELPHHAAYVVEIVFRDRPQRLVRRQPHRVGPAHLGGQCDRCEARFATTRDLAKRRRGVEIGD